MLFRYLLLFLHKDSTLIESKSLKKHEISFCSLNALSLRIRIFERDFTANFYPRDLK